jgi:hypothetical protein
MREAVRQSINGGLRKANSEKTACDIRIIHDSLNLFQTAPWNFGIDVDEPENVATRGARTSVHLCCPATLAYDKLIAKALRAIGGAVRACTVCDNNLCARYSLAQMHKKRLNQPSLIQCRHDDRNNHGIDMNLDIKRGKLIYQLCG